MSAWTAVYAYLFLSGLVASWALTITARKLAFKTGYLDMPKANKYHKQPTPLLGGLAVCAAFCVVLGLNTAVLVWFPEHIEKLCSFFLGSVSDYTTGVPTTVSRLGLIVGGAVGMMVLGLIDDKHSLHAGVKLIGQIIIASILIACGFKITLFISAPMINSLITLVWIIAVVNSFNLLDNVDGLCGGIAAICALMIFIVSFLSGQFFVSSFAILLIGCFCGFLIHNFPPARIFMGDAGSMFAGYMLAVLSIITTFYSPSGQGTPAAVVLPAIILALPMFDTLSVIVVRVANGKPIYIGDKNHFSHRLIRLGMSTRRAVLFIYFITLSTGLGAVLLFKLDTPGAVIVLLQTVCLFTIIGMLEYTGKNKIS